MRRIRFCKYKYIRSYMITETSVHSAQRNDNSIQVYSILYDHWNYLEIQEFVLQLDTSIFDLIWSLKHIFVYINFIHENTSIFDLIWSLKLISKDLLANHCIQVYSILYDHWNIQFLFEHQVNLYKYIRSYMITETILSDLFVISN